MKDPYNPSRWMLSTNPNYAFIGTLKQVKKILRIQKYAPSKGFHMVDYDTGKKESSNLENYKGSAGAYLGKNDICFNEKILDDILTETEQILGLAGWNMPQLETYMNELEINVSKFDSGISDIEHVLQEYEKAHDGKKPPANKAAQLSYLLLEVRQKRAKTKQCQCYIRVMQEAIKNHYDLEKLKLELSNNTYTDYKGRTEYYNLAKEILG